MKWEHVVFYAFALLSYYGVVRDYIRVRKLSRTAITEKELATLVERRGSLRNWVKPCVVLTLLCVLLIVGDLKDVAR